MAIRNKWLMLSLLASLALAPLSAGEPGEAPQNDNQPQNHRSHDGAKSRNGKKNRPQLTPEQRQKMQERRQQMQEKIAADIKERQAKRKEDIAKFQETQKPEIAKTVATMESQTDEEALKTLEKATDALWKDNPQFGKVIFTLFEEAFNASKLPREWKAAALNALKDRYIKFLEDNSPASLAEKLSNIMINEKMTPEEQRQALQAIQQQIHKTIGHLMPRMGGFGGRDPMGMGGRGHRGGPRNNGAAPVPDDRGPRQDINF